ncbi:MAG: DNA (cytosine-5-)-methyltransferase, partial [Candidatus Omnitrophica bacterium]|nr:DNA (cytosine-5-)-methyltransferase [Candidatus Omnitrophota bacterium]
MTGQATLFEIEEKTAMSWFSSAIDFFNLSNTPGWPDQFGDQLRMYFCNKSRVNTLSLFSGGGGLDIAFHDAGFNIVECIEIEKRFTKTLEANSLNGKRLSNTKVTCIDIRDYEPEHKRIDFIIGGPPCQTFSAAGARAAGVNALDDKRGTLFEEYVRILKKTQPRGFLFENVYRIVGAQNGRPWEKIQEAFRSTGYKLYWRIIDAADYGAPQHRERLIIVGLKEGEFLFPCPTHGPDSSDRRPYYTAGLAVKGLDVSGCKIGINGRHGYLLNDIPPGLNYSFYTEKLGHPKPVFGWRSKFSDYLYKADPHTPVRTIKAQGGQYTGPFSWDNRPFTVEEYKRLQTFPDDYELIGKRQDVIAQLGNSVPPQCGRILALSVMDQVFREELPFEMKYLPSNRELGFRKRKSALTEIYAFKAKKAISNLQSLGMMTESIVRKRKGRSIQYLKDDFVLCDCGGTDTKGYLFEFEIKKTNWMIKLSEVGQDCADQYQINIELSAALSSIVGTKSIALKSASRSPASLLALWKFLEKKIKELAHKDDLIQLFGYYQYRQESAYRFDILNSPLKREPFWKITAQVVNGIALGKQVHILEMCDIFGADIESLLSTLKKLKEIGYEIRSHNTNSQFERDHYLIPYPFAT